jgi:hypothetical protein
MSLPVALTLDEPFNAFFPDGTQILQVAVSMDRLEEL